MMHRIYRTDDAKVPFRMFQAGTRKQVWTELAQPLYVRHLDGADEARRQTPENSGNVDGALARVQPFLAHRPPRLLDRRWHAGPIVAHVGEVRPGRRDAIELFNRDPASVEV